MFQKLIQRHYKEYMQLFVENWLQKVNTHKCRDLHFVVIYANFLGAEMVSRKVFGKYVTYPFQGLNVGSVSEGGGAEQKAGLQVSLQFPYKSSKVDP